MNAIAPSRSESSDHPQEKSPMQVSLRRFRLARFAALASLLTGASGCQNAAAPPSASAPPAPAATSEGADATLEPAPEATPFPAGLASLVEPFKGDFDEMLKRRVIRVLTVQNPVLHAVDRGREIGMTYDAVKAFEKRINAKAGNKIVTVNVIALPVARDELIPRLLAGQGDIAAAALTVTHDRQKLVDFSLPFASDVREVLVSGADAPPLAGIDDLAGRELYLRESSSYAEHIRKLNERFKVEGKKPVTIRPAPEVLEDGDILEMVNAGLVPATVVDSFMADLYLQVFPNLRRHEGIASPPVSIAWAFRKNSPRLAEAVNAFVRTHAQGTLAGNVLIGKYLKTTQWVKNARSDEERRRFESMIVLFRKYGKQYDLDSLLMAAQGYQESGLDQAKRSRVGAIGVMQVMPATARDKAVGIPDIEKLDSNIHAGIKYNRWVVDNFYNDPAISPRDRQLFAFASYNAGPSRVASLRREAKAQGLDPNKWFNNVELVAAKRIGRETVTYVSNIYKYYLAYQMMLQQREERRAAKAAAEAAMER
jgi:membrane-bound lytic murein transglycosylase MltF